ncbi:MAG TPA: bifunctional glutamate N-acetyltransferase/amino-acid acetyltransferase ArgJ [Actinomycetota bacterium]
MSVTYPKGFQASGVTAGCKPSGLPDLGLLVGEPGTMVAGLFTTNRVEAAPVTIGRARLRAGGSPRAVVVNSGQANAATGARGVADALAITARTGALLGLEDDTVLPSSTGVIGEPLHMERLLPALPTVVEALSKEGGAEFARAIMTTDTVDKQATAEAAGVRVGGCAKGVGMIAPDLATMLAFITTDAAIAQDDLHRLADEVLKPRFNAFTVDGSTSTNDTVLLFASGAAGHDRVGPGSGAWTAISGALAGLADDLVRQLIGDGEGVGHVVVVDVEGAHTEADARIVARAVADSPLVKTAAFGGDPNPGRILQAVGASGVGFEPTSLSVRIGDAVVAEAGVIPAAYFAPASELAERARRQMKDAEIPVAVSIGDGPGRARVFGCDLSYEYVRINGEYTT